MVKFDTYVGVFTNSGKMKFVTAVHRSDAVCESGKPALELSEDFAKDIVYGLTLNGYPSAVLRVLHGVELSNGEE